MKKQPAAKYKTVNDEEDDDFYYHCDKCSQESDGATFESHETNMSLQYLTDEGKNNIIYTIYNSILRVTQSPYFLDVKFGI